MSGKTGPIRVVFFDLGNVLVKVNYKAIIAKIADIFRIPEELVLQPSLLAVEKQFEKGQLTIAEHLEAVKKIFKSGDQITIDDLEKIWEVAFELNVDVWQIAQKLRQQVPLFLLSNTNALHIGVIRRKYDILDYLDGLILSYEAGVLKPEPQIFEYALQKAGVTDRQALFIDDLAENVAGAERCGISAHLFSTPTKLQEFIRKYGFDI